MLTKPTGPAVPDPFYHQLGEVLGVTGTRHGATTTQLLRVREFIQHPKVTEIHHGDCEGFDAQVHAMALAVGKHVVVHPPTDPKFRAFCGGPPELVTILPEALYHHRNRDILDRADFLLGGSSTPYEVVRSGSWSTVRRAVRQTVPFCVVGPGGEFVWPE